MTGDPVEDASDRLLKAIEEFERAAEAATPGSPTVFSGFARARLPERALLRKLSERDSEMLWVKWRDTSS